MGVTGDAQHDFLAYPLDRRRDVGRRPSIPDQVGDPIDGNTVPSRSEQDLEQRLLIVARNDAEQILAALHKQLAEFGRLVEGAERARLEEAAARLDKARSTNDRELISELVEQLNELSTPFAGRIMDAAIKQALQKKSVDELS